MLALGTMLALKTTAPLVNQKIQDETGLTITQRTVGEGLGTRPECARKDASSHIAIEPGFGAPNVRLQVCCFRGCRECLLEHRDSAEYVERAGTTKSCT